MLRTTFKASAIGLIGIGLLSVVLSATASAQLRPVDAMSRARMESDFLAAWPAHVVCMSYNQEQQGQFFEQQNALFRLSNAYLQISRQDFRTPVGGMVVYESRVAGQDRTLVINAATKRIMSIGGSLPQPNSCYPGMSIDPATRAVEDRR